MKPFYRRRRVLLTALAALVAGGLAVAAMQKHDTPVAGKTAAEAAPVALQLGQSDAAQADRGVIRRRVNITGSLEAINQTVITAPVEAEVAEVRVRPGMDVSRGDVVLRFSTTDLELRLAQAQAQVDGARAQLQLASTTFEQQKALLAQQFISQNAFDNAQSALDSARSQLKAAQAAQALAREHVNDAAVRAPFKARVAERLVEPGQRVGPNTPLLRLVDTSQLELSAALAGNEVALVREGQPVELYIEGMDGHRVTGVVSRISPAADATTRRVPVYIRVDNGHGTLRAGLFAHGRITVDSAETVRIPEAAINGSVRGQQWVWRVRDGRLHKQSVITGSTDDDARLVAVLQGLQAGDTVLTVPGAQFRDGQPVQLAGKPR